MENFGQKELKVKRVNEEKLEKNQIFYGDNLKFLKDKDYFPSNYVDLIYLDPPFNSKKAYNIIYDKNKSKAQAKVFGDTWTWSKETQKTYDSLIEGDRASAKVKKTIKSFHSMLGDSNLMAYLTMITPRLVEMKRVLKETGSIYLHCDPTASHYLKMIMDSIFGKKNFKNEIIWQRTKTRSTTSKFKSDHDTVLFYTKTNEFVFNTQYDDIKKTNNVKEDKYGLYKDQPVIQKGDNKGDKERYFSDGDTTITLDDEHKWLATQEKIDSNKFYWTSNGNPRIKRYLEKGKPCGSIWMDMIIHNSSLERTGYPTQKPEELLKRIIKASCPEDGIVLDPFCGCGTTLISAEKLERKWIGIDITYLAVDVLRQRIEKDFGEEEGVNFEILGEPEGMAGAKNMSENNKAEFQKWIISKIGGTPNEKLSGDKGIDGSIFFKDGGEDKMGIIQETVAKSVSPSKVRDFEGTMERENTPIGIFVTFKEPTKGMKKEANKMGKYEDSFGNKYPKLQFLTVQEILNGEKPEIPNIRRHISKREVKKEWKNKEEQTTLD